MSNFDKRAKNWETDQKAIRAKRLSDATLAELNLEEHKNLDVMDFGCGTGLYGMGFLKYSRSLLGIDNSQGMLDVFAEKLEESDPVDLMMVDLEEEELNRKFDLIVSSMTIHHIENPLALMGKFKGMLKPNGKICIVDLDKEDGTFHGLGSNEEKGVKHYGFSEDELKSWAQDHQMSFHYKMADTITKGERDYGLFLAIYSAITD